jgi:hypothetical protein
VARRFVPAGPGVEARLDRDEVTLLRELCRQLADELVAVDDADVAADPVLTRLFPDGYRDDPEAAAELRSLIQGELREAKVAAARAVAARLDEAGPTGRIRLDEDAAQQWLTALNDLRLTLGTRLGVTEEPDDDLDQLADDDPERVAYDIYLLLGWLQDSLVEALLKRR